MSEQINENKQRFLNARENLLKLIEYEKCPIRRLKYKQDISKLDSNINKKEDIYEIYNDTFKRGEKAEKDFRELCVNKDIVFLKSTIIQDMYDHTDVFIINPETNRKIGVDVKTIKRHGRSNKDNDQIMWIEYNSPSGYKGWIYGNQHLIAQQFNGGFYMISRKSLLKYAEKLKKGAKTFTRTKANENKPIPFYELYKRGGDRPADAKGIVRKAKDVTMIVWMQDVLDNCNVKIWYN